MSKNKTDKQEIEFLPRGSGVANPVDIHVGQRIRQRRVLLGISQEKLAETMGMTFQQVQKYERGKNRVSASRLYQLSHILDVNISYFFDNFSAELINTPKAVPKGMSDNDQAGLVDDAKLQDKETLNLLRVYYSIKDKKARKDIMTLIRTMARHAGNDVNDDDEE